MKNYHEQMIKEMKLRNFVQSTQNEYLKAMDDLVAFCSLPPEEITLEQIKEFLIHFKNNTVVRGRTGRSPRTVNRHRSGIIFYYKYILKRYHYSTEIPPMKTVQKNPTILSVDEVKSLIDSVHKAQYRVILMIFYSTGLRLSEVKNLKITDIDSKRMIINIRNGKGGKDRQAILTPMILKMLREYWEENPNKHSKWLFTPSVNSFEKGFVNKPMSHTAYNYIFKVATKAAGIKKKVHPHVLRHSFSVHMLEKGVNLRHIQFLLGHSSLRSTLRYTTIADISKINAPDLLDELFSGEEQ